MRRDAAELFACAAIALMLFVIAVAFLTRQLFRSLTEHLRMNEESGFVIRITGSLLDWGWLVALAIWGGTAAHIERMRKNDLTFSMATLLGDLIVSSFVGMLTAYICVEMGASFYFTAAACGVVGHQGGRAIGLLVNWVKARRFS